MSAYAEMILPEFDQEMTNTRKVLERIPDDKLDWKPHPKSNTIGWNATHLAADLPAFATVTLTRTSLDIAPPGGEPWRTPKLDSTREILDLFDRNVAAARKAIESTTDEAVREDWSLLRSGTRLFTMPRAVVMRSFVLNHMVHHRAVLCVYLRMNDVPVPGMYGPSGDE